MSILLPPSSVEDRHVGGPRHQNNAYPFESKKFGSGFVNPGAQPGMIQKENGDLLTQGSNPNGPNGPSGPNGIVANNKWGSNIGDAPKAPPGAKPLFAAGSGHFYGDVVKNAGRAPKAAQEYAAAHPPTASGKGMGRVKRGKGYYGPEGYVNTQQHGSFPGLKSARDKLIESVEAKRNSHLPVHERIADSKRERAFDDYKKQDAIERAIERATKDKRESRHMPRFGVANPSRPVRVHRKKYPRGKRGVKTFHR